MGKIHQVSMLHHVEGDDNIHRPIAWLAQGMDIKSVVGDVGWIRPHGLVLLHVAHYDLSAFTLYDVDEMAAPLPCVHVLCPSRGHLAQGVGQLGLDKNITRFIPTEQAVPSLEEYVPCFRKNAQHIPILPDDIDHP